MSDTKPTQRCGTHTELAVNGSTRITRCACGAVHVSLTRSGVTVQMNASTLVEVAAAAAEAAREVEGFGASPDRAAAKSCAN